MLLLRDLLIDWPSSGRGIDIGINNLREGLETLDLDMNPEYQRQRVWTEDQRQAFAGHVLEGGKVPPIIVNEPRRDNGSTRFELVDGKQRLTAILDWMDGKLGARVGSRLIFRRDVEGRFDIGHTLRFDYVRLDEVDVLKFYLRLNRGSTPHTPLELQRVEALLTAREVSRG